MKTWTVVIEIKDEGLNASEWTKPEIEQFISESLTRNGLPFIAFQIFECTAAPYGPQGVVLTEVKSTPHCLCTEPKPNRACPLHGDWSNRLEAYKVGRAGRVQTAPKEGK